MKCEFGNIGWKLLHPYSKEKTCNFMKFREILAKRKILLGAIEISKVQLFWKDHKNLKKSPTCFDVTDWKQLFCQNRW